MSRMYFEFDTSLPDSKPDIPTPSVDYIAFRNEKSKKIISISGKQPY